MNYALIENGIVVNIIWLSDKNAHDFPDAVKIADRPVAIGDTYENGKFFRNGVEVLTEVERLQAEIETYKTALNTVGVQTEEVTDYAE